MIWTIRSNKSSTTKTIRIHDLKLAYAMVHCMYMRQKIWHGDSLRCAVCDKVAANLFSSAYRFLDTSHELIFAHRNCMKGRSESDVIKDYRERRKIKNDP